MSTLLVEYYAVSPQIIIFSFIFYGIGEKNLYEMKWMLCVFFYFKTSMDSLFGFFFGLLKNMSMLWLWWYLTGLLEVEKTEEEMREKNIWLVELKDLECSVE